MKINYLKEKRNNRLKKEYLVFKKRNIIRVWHSIIDFSQLFISDIYL